MTALRLHVDEDSTHHAFVQGLRARAIDVTTVQDAGTVGWLDEDQLRWATSHGRVLYSFNDRDFYRLHSEFLERGESHAGIILAVQQRHSVGDQIRGFLRLHTALIGEEMIDRVEFPAHWIEQA